MRHLTFPFVLFVLVTFSLFGCGSNVSREQQEPLKQSEQQRAGRAPACGQSTVLGKAQMVYNTAQECVDGRTDLKNKAKDDLIKECNDYCAFLGATCEPSPKLTRENVTVDDYPCDRVQDDGKIHARAVVVKDCICKAKI